MQLTLQKGKGGLRSIGKTTMLYSFLLEMHDLQFKIMGGRAGQVVLQQVRWCYSRSAVTAGVTVSLIAQK